MAEVAEYIKIMLLNGHEAFVLLRGENKFLRTNNVLKLVPSGRVTYTRSWRNTTNSAWFSHQEEDVDLKIEDIHGDFTILEGEEQAIKKQQDDVPHFGQ